MKYNDVFSVLKTATKVVEDPYIVVDMFKESKKRTPYEEDLGAFEDYEVDDVYENYEVTYNEKSDVYKESNNDYEDQLNNSRKIDEEILEEKKPIYSNNELLDAITHEITPFGLQQAIVLSEIISKPRSKTRRQRRRY